MQAVKEIVAVFGANGKQGGSVVSALLQDDTYAVRAIVRDKTNAAALELIDRGCEVRQCDYNDNKHLEHAINGVTYAFIVTNFWDPATGNKEEHILRSIAHACKKDHIKHVVVSSLPNVQKESNDKYHVPHFTNKAKGLTHFEEFKIPHTSFEAAFYYQNFYSFIQPTKSAHDEIFSLPDCKELTAFDVNETGEAVLKIFQNHDQWKSKRVCMTGSNMSMQEYIECLDAAKDHHVHLKNLTTEESTAAMGKELTDMFGWINEFGYYGEADYTTGAALLGRPLKTFSAYSNETYGIF